MGAVVEDGTFHARLSPSGADRWMVCTASVVAEQGYEDSSSSFANEGTLAHHLAELCLSRDEDPVDYVGQAIGCSSSAGPISLVVKQDFAVDVQVYVDTCRELIEDKKVLPEHIWIEQRVHYDDYVAEGSGTADLIVFYVEDGVKVLHVVDLKFGKGVAVTAHENRQGRLYGLGAYSTFEWMLEMSPTDIVRIGIHQPRIGHGEPSTWDVTVADLIRFAEDARDAAQAIEDGKTKFAVSEKGCRFCKHKNRCDFRAKELLKEMSLGFDDDGAVAGDLPVTGQGLTNVQIASILKRASEITGFVNSLKEMALDAAINDGVKFEGMKLIRGRSSKNWADPKKAADELEALIGEDATYSVQKIITPTQALKLIGKGRETELEEFIVKPQGKLSLVLETDKGDPYEPDTTEGFDD